MLVVAPEEGCQGHVVLETVADGSAFAWAVVRLTPGSWFCCLPVPVHRRMAPPTLNNLNVNRLCTPPLAMDTWEPIFQMAAVITREG